MLLIIHSKGVFLLRFPPISSRYQTARQTQSGRGLLTHFAAGLCLSLHFYLLSHSTVLPHCSLNLRDKVSPWLLAVSGRWSVSPFCLLGQAWIQTRVLTSLMSSASLPLLVPVPHQVSLCIGGPRPDLLGGWIPLQIKLSVGSWWDLLLVVWGDTPWWQGRW
jgi:hypothetical protein